MRNNYFRMQTYSVYFDKRLSWYPNAWVYKNSYAIKSRWPVFREHPEWIGPGIFIGADVPSPGYVESESVAGDWRMCTACHDAFQATPASTFLRCPKCGEMTKLRRDA